MYSTFGFFMTQMYSTFGTFFADPKCTVLFLLALARIPHGSRECRESAESRDWQGAQTCLQEELIFAFTFSVAVKS